MDIIKKYFGLSINKYDKEYYLGANISFHDHFYSERKAYHFHFLLELILFYIELRIGSDFLEEEE